MRSIFTKWYGPTNTKGAKVRAFSDGGNVPKAVTVSGQAGDNKSWRSPHLYAAQRFAVQAGWSGVWVMGSGMDMSGQVFVNVGQAAPGLVRALKEDPSVDFFVVPRSEG